MAAPESVPRPRRNVRRIITDEQLLECLDNSDIELSGDSDEEFQPWDEHANSEDGEIRNEDSDIADDNSSDETTESHVNPQKPEKFIWKKKKFPAVDLGDFEEPPMDPTELLTPYEYFSQFLDDEFFEMTAQQTNLYAVQKNGRSIKTDLHEMRKLAGMHLVMGVLQLPQARMYWSRFCAIPMVSDAMPRDRFFVLRSHLHFADNLDPKNAMNSDKLWKVRPILNAFRSACLKIPRPVKCSIDEQMIPFSGRCGFRQYLPSKPNPVGLKNFVLASTDGAVLDFKIYTGKDTFPADVMKELGLGGAAVKKLCATLIDSDKDKHLLFTDRYFTGTNILIDMLKKNIFITGTIMANRINEVSKKMKADNAMTRGECDERIRSDEKVCVVKWKDNKSVLLMSAILGSEPTDVCKRWSKQEKKHVEVSRPAIVREYNKEMGGVDLCDRYVSYYRSSIRTNKWPIRVYAHFLDLAVTNGWVLYRREYQVSGQHAKYVLPLIEFRLAVAEALLKASPEKRGPGRPPIERPVDPVPPTGKAKVIPLPCADVRFDNVGHLPKNEHRKYQSKCRMEGCKGKTRIMCVKCQVFLCLLNKDCFLLFHTK